jgi:hypothetical protein
VDRFDVVAVAPSGDGPQMEKRRFEIRAVGRPVGGPGLLKHRR